MRAFLSSSATQRRRIAVAAVAALTLFLSFSAGIAYACSCGWVDEVVGIGGSIPANAAGVFRARMGDTGEFYPVVLDVVRSGSTRVLVTRRCESQTAPGTLCFGEPLKDGDILYPRESPRPRDGVGSFGIRVVAPSSLPKTLGALVADAAAPVAHARGSEVCGLADSLDVLAVAVHVEFSEEMRPWVDGARFRTFVDGREWKQQGHLCSSDNGRSWQGAGKDLLFGTFLNRETPPGMTAFDPGPPVSELRREYRPLSPGAHSVFVEARIPGGRPLRTNTVRITLPAPDPEQRQKLRAEIDAVLAEREVQANRFKRFETYP